MTTTDRQNPFLAGQAPRRSCSVELVDVARQTYRCRDCGKAVRLGTREPLPTGWQALPAPRAAGEADRWHYLCPDHATAPKPRLRRLPRQGRRAKMGRTPTPRALPWGWQIEDASTAAAAALLEA